MRQHVATVRFEAEDRTSQSGRLYSSVAVAIEGQEQLTRLFGPPGHEPFRGLRRGQQVAIAIDSQGKAHLLEQPQQQGQPMGFHPGGAAAPTVQHQAPGAYGVPPQPTDPATALADVWATCFARLVAAGVPPEVAGPGASTILIQLGRR